MSGLSAPPPHERPWRHPSELPPPPHEPQSRTARALIVSTATIGLLMVGVLALRMTPGRALPQEAVVGSSTSFPELATQAPVDGTLPALFASEAEAALTHSQLTDAVRGLVSLTGGARASSIGSSTQPGDTAAVPAFVVVTPLGVDGLGVTTESALAGRTGVIEAVLPSGDVVECEVVSIDGGVAVMAVRSSLPTNAATFELDEARPALQSMETNDVADVLTVVADGERFDVDGPDLADLAVPEASPVLDRDGSLVGLTTVGTDGSVGLLSIDTLPPPAQPVSTEEPTTVTESTAPDTVESLPATSEPPTTEPTTSRPPGTNPESTPPPATSEPSSSVPATSQPDSTTPNPDTSEPATTLPIETTDA